MHPLMVPITGRSFNPSRLLRVMIFITRCAKRNLHAFCCLNKRALRWFVERGVTLGRELELSASYRRISKALRTYRMLDVTPAPVTTTFLSRICLTAFPVNGKRSF